MASENVLHNIKTNSILTPQQEMVIRAKISDFNGFIQWLRYVRSERRKTTLKINEKTT